VTDAGRLGASPLAQPVRRSTWIAFAAVTTGTFAVNLDRTMVAVALPQIGNAFGAAGLDSIVTLNLVAVAVASPGAGWLADRYGTRTVLMAALSLFGVASLAAAMSPSMATLLVSRALQGASGGVTLAVTLATVHALFEPAQRPRAFAVQAAVMMVSPAVGPLYGGWISAVDWRITFLVVAAFGAVAIVAVACFVPTTPSRRAQEPVDWPGWLLVAVGLPSALMVATFGSEWGWSSTRVCALAIAGVVGLSAFVWRQLRIPSPLMRLRVLGNRKLRTTFVLEWFITIPYQSQFVLLPLELTSIVGASPLSAGAMITPSAIGTMLSLRPASRMLTRRGARINVMVGCGFLALATVGLALVQPDTPLWAIAALMVPHGLGGGFCLMPLLVVGLDAVTPSLVPQVSAMRIVNKLVAQAVGVAASVGLLTALVGGDLLAEADSDPAGRMAAYRTVDWLLTLPLVLSVVMVWRDRTLDSLTVDRDATSSTAHT
jgi:EmrB/QacA subfamily drug resistance transporter